MYYIFLGRKNDFSSPEKIIVEYDNHYFYREKHTDWFFLEEEEKEIILNGDNNKYCLIDESQFDNILSLWGGSKTGYKNMNVNHDFDNLGYGDSYDEDDEINND